MFGLGQPLKVYWQNGNFNVSRFEGYSSNFLFYMRLSFLVPHLLWHCITIVTNQGEYMNYFYYWTYWSWCIAIISQILTMLAAHRPDYWHVMAFAWLEISHSINLAVTFAFWCILTPMIYQYFKVDQWATLSFMEKFIIIHMIILHATPLMMTWTNIHFTDIKLLSADWKLMAFHGFFYMFANYLGFFDFDHAMYPIIDWKNYAATIAVFVLGIFGMCVGFYKCWCSWADGHYKRRGEK